MDCQLDLLLLTINYNTTESLQTPSVLQLTTEYHSNSAAIITAATLSTGELLVPFLPFLGYELNSFNSLTTPKTLKTELSELNSELSILTQLRGI
jgi:hypothetical protein